MAVENRAIVREPYKSVRNRYVVEHSAFQVSNEEIGRPYVGKLVVIQCNALVVTGVSVGESLISPRLSQVGSHRILLMNRTHRLE